MSRDTVALTRDQPDLGTVLNDVGLQLQLRLGVDTADGDGRVYDEAGQLIVFVSEPVQVYAPGEVERLLGVPSPLRPPLWWVDIRAAVDLGEAAARVARQCADQLAARYGGVVWTGAGP
jgi:hypothetical protein